MQVSSSKFLKTMILSEKGSGIAIFFQVIYFAFILSPSNGCSGIHVSDFQLAHHQIIPPYVIRKKKST